jgi:hypothetical protein
MPLGELDSELRRSKCLGITLSRTSLSLHSFMKKGPTSSDNRGKAAKGQDHFIGCSLSSSSVV